jgi:AcrR family transcriptional regulator
MVQEEGRDALSMRKLAKELGVTPMALYHHIPDKPALMNALVERVWLKIFSGMPVVEGDAIETLVQTSVRVRKVWLEHFDLANLAVAVAEPDDDFYTLTLALTTTSEAAGFPDPPLAYSAIQNFTMGSIQTAANRKAASLYFGRDPKAVRRKARRLLDKHNASEHHRRLVEARFDEGDEENFEPSLRALVAGLMQAPKA